jgi:hypothetical protein
VTARRFSIDHLGRNEGSFLVSSGAAYSLKRIDSEYLNNPQGIWALSAGLLNDPD